MADFTRTVAADLDNLAEIRRFVRESATALGTDLPTICSLELAVDEAACNTIRHGYKGQAGSIEVEIERDGDVLVLRLRDRAPLFDPTTVPDPDLTLALEKRPLGGMGISLIRHSVDKMVYRVTPDGKNELTLIKRLHKEQDNGHSHL